MAAPLLTTRQLQALSVVHELRNISHAAVKLSMSQPALSRMLTRIEAVLDTQLFERDSRGVTPTEAGERAARRAVEILALVRSMENEIRTLDGEPRGAVCVAMPDTVGHSLFLPLIDRVSLAYPDVELRVMDSHPNNVSLAIAAGDADVGIVSDAHNHGSLVVSPLALENLHLVEHGGRRADRAEVELRSIAATPLALPGIRPGLRQVIDKAFATKGLTPNVVMELDSQDALIESIREGRVSSIMSFAGVRRHVDRGEVTARRIVDPTIDRRLLTALPEGRPTTRLMRTIEAEIRALSTDLASLARWEILS